MSDFPHMRPAGSSDPNAHPDREPGTNPAALPPIAGEVKIPSRLQSWAIQAGLMIIISIVVALISRHLGVKIEVPPPPVVVIEGAGPGTTARVQGGAEVQAERRRPPLRERLAQRLIDDAVAAGADRAKAEQVVADWVADSPSERPILDWLRKGGWKELLELILKLIALL